MEFIAKHKSSIIGAVGGGILAVMFAGFPPLGILAAVIGGGLLGGFVDNFISSRSAENEGLSAAPAPMGKQGRSADRSLGQDMGLPSPAFTPSQAKGREIGG